jgi:peptide deformylase
MSGDTARYGVGGYGSISERWLSEQPERSIISMTVKPAELTILHYPAAALRAPARAILKIDQHVKDVAARMIELMHDANGVGLAAPQVGLPWRMFVTDAPDDEGPRVFINPKLTGFSAEKSTSEEGCLSLPGIQVEVERPAGATITALDLDGHEFSINSDEFVARVWQHEFDHLNGVLIIDRVSADERQELRQKLKEMKASAAFGGRGF